MTPSAVVTWRHRLHQIAETAFAEHRTADFIADTLRSLGLEVATGVGGTGVVGTLTRGTSGRAIGLRADMDALPLHEATGLPYASEHAGSMHACGHDGHMAMLLGAAAALAEDGDFDGTVRFVFQPAEEPGQGAAAMIKDGLFDRFGMDAIFGLHNIPGIPVGHLVTRATVNHPDATATATATARETVGEDQCDPATPPIMASEDFGLYADHVPTNFTFIGNGTTGATGGIPLHSHDYDFNDTVLPIGVRYYQNLIHRSLPR